MNGGNKNIQSKNSDRLNSKNNPTVVRNLQAPENYFVDKYGNFWNGTYHIHRQGQFCKGTHTDDMLMSTDNFLRPYWLVEQYTQNRQTRNQKVNWNGQSFEWEYNVYYTESGDTNISCIDWSDQGNKRYIILPNAAQPGDECFDFSPALGGPVGNYSGCTWVWTDDVDEYYPATCKYDCDFMCVADIFFPPSIGDDDFFPYPDNGTCTTCGGGTASYPNFQLVHDAMIGANPYTGPFNNVNTWCEQFEYDGGDCDPDSNIDPTECIPPRIGQADVWIEEVCVFENRDQNNGGGENGNFYNTWLFWFPHFNTNAGVGYATLGCTDMYALNYDSNAEIDDGSCEYPDGWGTASDYRGCFVPSEIKYRASENQTKYDFIEFQNNCGESVDISGWWFHCGYGTDSSMGFCDEGGILWRFPSNTQSENTCGWSPDGSTNNIIGCYPLGSQNHSHDLIETTHIIPDGGRVVLERHGSDGPQDTEFSSYSGSFKFRGTLNNTNTILLYDNTGALVTNFTYQPGTDGWPSGAYETGFSIENKYAGTNTPPSLETLPFETVDNSSNAWQLSGLIPCNALDATTCAEYYDCGCRYLSESDVGFDCSQFDGYPGGCLNFPPPTGGQGICSYDYNDDCCHATLNENGNYGSCGDNLVTLEPGCFAVSPDVMVLQTNYPMCVGLDSTQGGGPGLPVGIDMGTMTTSYTPGGCTDPISNNYNFEARWNDGTCNYPNWGNEEINDNPIIINEIHWNPSIDYQGEDRDYEFIEIHNRTSNILNMAGVQLTTQELSEDSDEFTRFQFPIGSEIQGNSYVVIANNMSTYMSADYEWLVPNYNLFEWQEFYTNTTDSVNLDNDGMTLRLRDADDNLIDQVQYFADWGGDGSGFSIEVIDSTQNNNISDNWITSQVLGGTPGLPNTPNQVGCIDELDISYDPNATIMCDGCCSQISIYNGGIIITEIRHRNPSDGGAGDTLGYEFIEIYNNYDTPINLLDFTIYAVGWTGDDSSMPGVTIAPGELMVLCQDGTLYDGCIQWPVGGSLLNEGELITIRDPNYNVVDEVPLTELISNIGNTEDYTYELIYEGTPEDGIDNYNWNNWRRSDFVGGSPGQHSTEVIYGCTDPFDISYDPDANFHDSEQCSEISIYEGGIVITEIKDRYEDGEFIEIYNTRDEDISLEGFRIFAVGWTNEYPIPPEIIVPSGGFVVLASLEASQNLETIHEHLTLGINLFSWPINESILNEGELIRITDPGNNEVDKVDTFGLITDLGQAGSYSWELVEFYYGGNQFPSSWQISSIIGGTPGLLSSLPASYGCTDPTAVNYDNQATIDDGSCAYYWGDVNQDNTVDILDVITIVNYVLSNIELSDSLAMVADINQDSTVNILDIIELVNNIVGGNIFSDDLENIIRDRTGLNDTEEDIPLTQLLRFLEFLFSKTNSNIINNVTHQYGKNSAEKILNEAKRSINQARLNLSLDDNAYHSLNTINNLMDDIIINPREQGLIVSEVMLDSTLGSYYLYQFVEIYNNQNQAMDITGWRFRSQLNDGTTYTRYTFGCPTECRICPEEEQVTTVLQSYQYMVIANTDGTYDGINNLTTGQNLFEWQKNGVCGASSHFNVSRDLEDSIRFVIDEGSSSNIVTEVRIYNDGSDGKPDIDTLLSSNSTLEVIDVGNNTSEPTNWQASYISGGTPGAQNTQVPIPGCTDPLSCTYNPIATIDDGSCLYLDCNGECGGDSELGACGCEDDTSCAGCTDPLALNYDSDATVDDGSCEYFNYLNSIVINEIHYNPSTTQQGEDSDYEFVELYNKSGQTIPMEGIHFTTQVPDSTEYSRFVFPVVDFQPNSYMVLANNVNTYSSINGLVIGQNLFEWQETYGDSGNIVELSNTTLTLRLRDPFWLPGDETGLIDFVPYVDSWGGDASGRSLELKQEELSGNNYDPNAWQESLEIGGSPGLPNPFQIFGCTDPLAENYNSEANVEDGTCTYLDYTDMIVISEIHYNPSDNFQGDDSDYEFIEIYNRSGQTININGFKFSMEGSGEGAEEYNRFIFPDIDFPNDSYIVVAINSTPPIDNQNVNPYENLEVGVNLFEWVGDQAWTLNNFDAMNLRIKSPDDSVITNVTYSGIAPWPQNIAAGGSSIELIDLNGDNNDPNNWQASYLVNGTPGQSNSTPEDETIIGCTDPTSCSYNPNANVLNPEACIYEDDYGNILDCGEVTTGEPSGIFGCDCAGQCGGSTWLDHCGVCQGDGTTCDFEWGSGIEVEPINDFGVSVNYFKFKPIGNDPTYGTWVSPYTDDTGQQCQVVRYQIVIDRKIDDEQISPESPYTVNQNICNEADCTCTQCALDEYFLPQGGYIKLLENAGTYFVAYTVEDSCGNLGNYQVQFEVLDSLNINQTINTSYIPNQSIDFDTSTMSNLSKFWFEQNNRAPKPPLGMFYYDEDQPPFLTWESVVGDSYEDFDFDITNDISSDSTLLGVDVSFSPDLNVRTYRSKSNLESVPYKYYDIDLQEEEYYENTAPTELEFYFYLREGFTNPLNFFVDRAVKDFEEGVYDSSFRFFVGFLDWGDGSDIEFTEEPQELFNNTIIKHTYNNPGVYEVIGYVVGTNDGSQQYPAGYFQATRFTFRHYLGKDETYEQPYVEINKGNAIISGISPYSIYYKTISRQLGYYPDLDGLVDLYFDQYYDKLDTEYALAQMDSSRIGENLLAFSEPVYDQSVCGDTPEVCDDDEITCPNGTCEDYIYNCTNTCLTGWFKDESIPLDENSLIWSGDEFNNFGALGDYLGEVDIAQSRVYLEGNKSMWEILGFSGNNAEASVEVLEAIREQAVLITAPHGTKAFRPTINSTHGYDTYTSSWAVILHQLMDIPVIYAKYRTEDPNFYHDVPFGSLTPAYEDLIGEKMPYKRVVQKYLEEHPNIKFVIDLHGASWTRPFALDLGFMGVKNTLPEHAYVQPNEEEGSYPLYNWADNVEEYCPSLKTIFGKQEFIPAVLDIMENNNIGYGDSDGYGVTVQHTYSGGGTQNTTTAWVTRDADSEFITNPDKFVDGVQFEWSRDYRRFEYVSTIEQSCTNQLGELVDEAYDISGALSDITDEYSCTNTGFCYGNNNTIINDDLSELGENGCNNHESGNYQWFFNNYEEFETEPSVTDTRSTQSMIDVINYINGKYNYENIEPTDESVLVAVNQVDAIWDEQTETGEVTLDDEVVPLENHPGNPGDTRYWNNIIPSYYSLSRRDGVLIDGLGNYIINEENNQNWLLYGECADVEWDWEELTDGSNDNYSNQVKCYDVFPYYPVLPKYNWKGEFDFSLGLQSDNTPFGSPYRFWSDYDDKAPSTNIYDNDNSLIIDLNTTDINENQIEDLSGNDNRGNTISDYRIDFDEETRKPKGTKPINKIKNETDNGAY